MRKRAVGMLFALLVISSVNQLKAQTVNGDVSLLDVSSGNNFNFSAYSGAKGVVVFFTSEHCPYAKLYENRVVALSSELKGLGIQTVMVNPNDGILSPDDAVDKMKAKSGDKRYPFPYLADKQQECSKLFGAQKTPEVFLIKPSGKGFEIVYRGAFDDNPMAEDEVKEKYLEVAARALAAGKAPAKKEVRPTGCMIKSR